MRISKHGLGAAAVAVSAILITLGIPDRVLAANACDFQATYLLGRHGVASTATYGARARIEYNNPDLCGSDATGPGFSSAWSMITADSVDPTNYGQRNYAQAGYVQIGGAYPGAPAGIFTFAQYTRKCYAHGNCAGDQDDFNTFGQSVWRAAPTGTAMYAVTLRSSDDRIHLYSGNTELLEVGYDVTDDWVAAWEPQFFGETKHSADDMPGTTADVTSFDYLQRYLADGSVAFLSNPLNSSVPHVRYHRQNTNPGVGGTGFNLWTDPL